MIITDSVGRILGITQSCMVKLGIPISFFKNKIESDDSITIYDLVKDLKETKVINELKTTGKNIELNTKPFLYMINRENLSSKETQYLENNAGKSLVYMKLMIEHYTQNIELYNYCMMIINDNEILESQQKIDLPVFDNDHLFENSFCKNKKVDNNASIFQMENEIDTRREFFVERKYGEIKQNINSKSTGNNTSGMNKWVPLFILILIGMATTEFTLMLDRKSVV